MKHSDLWQLCRANASYRDKTPCALFELTLLDANAHRLLILVETGDGNQSLSGTFSGNVGYSQQVILVAGGVQPDIRLFILCILLSR